MSRPVNCIKIARMLFAKKEKKATAADFNAQGLYQLIIHTGWCTEGRHNEGTKKQNKKVHRERLLDSHVWGVEIREGGLSRSQIITD